MNNIKQILLVGYGPHTERVYAPCFYELEKDNRVRISCILEVAEKMEYTKEKVGAIGFTADVIEVNRTEKSSLSTELRLFLNNLNEKYHFDGICIATEPTQHKQYILWALEQKLHILVDKPITTYDDVSNNIALAQEINKDFQLFLSMYSDRTKAFIVNAQRRYHNGFRFVLSKIREISDRFQIPVTSIQSMHSDGQWRFPDEVITEVYHGYSSGYGKVSHSGYHIIDMVNEFVRAGKVLSKEADEYEYFTKFIRPDGILKQVSLDDYKSFFPDNGDQITGKFAQAKTQDLSKYGEVDSYTSITAKRHGVNIANYSINLMHNTYSRRSWIEPGKDLYKGNGRVKHEYHNIVQGPLQTIQIHSYQASDNHTHNTKEDYNFGGNNHFDICIFRNNILTGDEVPLQRVSIDDLGAYNTSRLVTELTKKTVVYEFVDIMYGKKKPEDSLSYFTTHEESVRIMSMIYESAHQSGKVINSYKYES